MHSTPRFCHVEDVPRYDVLRARWTLRSTEYAILCIRFYDQIKASLKFR